VTVAEALDILTRNAEWAAGIDVVRHHEEYAEAFHRETGLMAPGKAQPLGCEQDEDEVRRACRAWGQRQAEIRLEAVRVLARAVGGAS